MSFRYFAMAAALFLSGPAMATPVTYVFEGEAFAFTRYSNGGPVVGPSEYALRGGYSNTGRATLEFTINTLLPADGAIRGDSFDIGGGHAHAITAIHAFDGINAFDDRMLGSYSLQTGADGQIVS